MAAAIRFRSVVALMGGFPVLAGVDLDVARGEVVLLEGANGAGKTSLLRACAGLLTVTSGEAEVLGHDLLSDRRSVRRQVGLLGHATSLYDDLTVVDNVRFAIRAGGGRSDAVAPALEQLGLTGRLPATAVGRLSAGQRRRAALAVLVGRDPALWLLDEPHAGLDAEHRDLLDGLVRDAVARGATVVLASHEHERASALAGRVVTMAGGQVVTPTRSDPAPPVTSGPVGSSPVGSSPVGSSPVGSSPVGSSPVGSDPVASSSVGSDPVGSDPVATGSEPDAASPPPSVAPPVVGAAGDPAARVAPLPPEPVRVA